MSSHYRGQPPYPTQPSYAAPLPQPLPPPPPYDSSQQLMQNLSLGDGYTVPGAFPATAGRAAGQSPRSTPHRTPEAPTRPNVPKISNRASVDKEDDTDDREKIHIAIMGVTGSGKSNFIQLCTQSKTVKVGHGLRSCTNEIGEHEFIWRDKHICLIDTPGFDDTTRTDREVLDDIAAWLGTAYQDKIELTGILYLQKIIDTRMSGVAFDNLKMFRKLCGKDYYPRVTLATTMWDLVKEATGKSRESELLSDDDFWRDMTKNGCRIDRHYGDRESAMDILRGIIKSRNKTNAPTFVQVQKEMVDDKLNLEETSAGKQVNAKIEEERLKMQKEWERTKRDMEESMREHDEHMANMYKKKQQDLETKLARGYEDQEKMKVELSQLQEQQLKHLEDVKRELAETRAQLEDSRDELERKLAEASRLDPYDPSAQKLEEEIAQLDARDEDLAAQEAMVSKKKTKWYKRLSRWAEENPKAVKTISVVLSQFVAAAARMPR